MRPLVSLVALGGLACGGATDEGKLPPEVPDPATLHTPAGALARYRGALALVPGVLEPLMTLTGILTDELAALPTPRNVSGSYTSLDSRRDLAGFEATYANLHRLRGQAREARGFLGAYAPDSSAALAGHLYALEGYAEVFLADLFCSGIPLSTVDFNGDYTLAAGSSTTEVYTHAVTLFDSALAMVNDSARLQPLAAVGRGRALLALGRYAEAAAAVAAVPDGYRYQVVLLTNLTASLLQGFASTSTGDNATGYAKLPGTPSVGDHEGLNGLDYRSSGDPRTPTVARPGTDPFGHTMYFPTRYPLTGNVTLTLADGLEARLIEAEAALQAGTGDWLTKLNALRTDGTFDTQPTADPNDDPAATDTLWHAGSGGVAGLRPLEDPGTEAGRIDLVFRERGFWLYLTGHRQGDLRRLVREYHRAPTAVYPKGFYEGGLGTYGDEVVAPVPLSELERNDQYTGCRDRDA